MKPCPMKRGWKRSRPYVGSHGLKTAAPKGGSPFRGCLQYSTSKLQTQTAFRGAALDSPSISPEGAFALRSRGLQA